MRKRRHHWPRWIVLAMQMACGEEMMAKSGEVIVSVKDMDEVKALVESLNAECEKWQGKYFAELNEHREMSAVAAERTAELLRYSAALERIIFMAKGAATGSPLWYCYVEADKAITEAIEAIEVTPTETKP